MSESSVPLMRVLVLDDDPDVRQLLERALQLLGAQSCTVDSVAELRQRRDEALACQLALLDVNLGLDQPSGLDACRWLSEHGFGGSIVFLTGHASTHPLVSQALKTPGTRTLSKPIRLERLRELLPQRDA
jgi:DNA-binding NtrC family response regulator